MRKDVAKYEISAYFLQDSPDSKVDVLFAKPTIITINYKQLIEYNDNADAYGTYLSKQIFKQPITNAWSRAIGYTEKAEGVLRLQLQLDSSDNRLHQIRWELLVDPEGKGFLALRANVLLSRYTDPENFPPNNLSNYEESRALILISNPLNGNEFNLGEIDVVGQEKMIRSSLGTVAELRFLYRISSYSMPNERMSIQGATLTTIRECLQSGFSILYLVCHGRIVDNEVRLGLEDADGNVSFIKAGKLIEVLQGIENKPSVFILTACYSDGSNSIDDLRPMGHRLAEMGIRVVLTMQDWVEQKATNTLISAFLKNIRDQGQVEHAISMARGMLDNSERWWQSTLYTNLDDGRLFAPKNVSLDHRRERISGLNLQYSHNNRIFEERDDYLEKVRTRIRTEKARFTGAKRGIHAIEPEWCEFHCKFFYSEDRETHLMTRQQGRTVAISKYPITIGHYKRFLDEFSGAYDTGRPYWSASGRKWLEDNAYPFPLGWDRPDVADIQPVYGVSWFEAVAYCNWLTHKLELRKKSMIIRLPTEYEWERAACFSERDMQLVEWEVPEYAFYAASREVYGESLVPPPIGCFPEGASPCGAMDMAGGVWEWCASEPLLNVNAPQHFINDIDYIDNAEREEDYIKMPIRGGSWLDPKTSVGWFTRDDIVADQQHPNVGFRVVFSEISARD